MNRLPDFVGMLRLSNAYIDGQMDATYHQERRHYSDDKQLQAAYDAGFEHATGTTAERARTGTAT